MDLHLNALIEDVQRAQDKLNNYIREKTFQPPTEKVK